MVWAEEDNWDCRNKQTCLSHLWRQDLSGVYAGPLSSWHRRASTGGRGRRVYSRHVVTLSIHSSAHSSTATPPMRPYDVSLN
jgi:hypothetical protein